MIHKHLANFLMLAQQIKEHGAAQVAELWQVCYGGGEWCDCTTSDLLFDSCFEYRLKPKNRTLKSDIEYPEPIWERSALKSDLDVYRVSLSGYSKYKSYAISIETYKNGLVQATEEGAKQMLAALQNALSGARDENY
jgi:hypothetical protein